MSLTSLSLLLSIALLLSLSASSIALSHLSCLIPRRDYLPLAHSEPGMCLRTARSHAAIKAGSSIHLLPWDGRKRPSDGGMEEYTDEEEDGGCAEKGSILKRGKLMWTGNVAICFKNRGHLKTMGTHRNTGGLWGSQKTQEVFFLVHELQ